MRGFPLINTILMLGILAAFAVVLLRLTSKPEELARGEKGQQSAVVAEQVNEEVELSLKFLHNPRFLLLKTDQEVLYKGAVEQPLELTVTLPEKQKALDVFVQAEWALPTTKSVVEVIVEPSAQEAQSQTLWFEGGSQRSLEEWISFEWRTSVASDE